VKSSPDFVNDHGITDRFFAEASSDHLGDT
jgi:hypothetical protein